MKTYLLKPNVRQAIAKAGETDVAVAFNATTWISDYPAGVPQLMVTRPDGVRVPVTVTVTDNLINGQVPDELMVNPGLYSFVFVWVSGATQLTSGRCECMVVGSDLAKSWADVRKAPDWAERIFLAASSIESAIPGMMEARNTTADNAAEAKAAAEEAAESKDAATDSAEAAAASEENIETILTNMEQTITDATAAMNGIEAQKNTMIASIAAIAEMGTDTTFTQSGVAADAQAVGTFKCITDVELDKIETAIDITASLGQQLERTANDDGCYWRYNQNAWQRTETTATAFWHVETYDVTPGVKYSVTGNIYHPAVPVCIYLDGNNNIIGSTEIPEDSTWQQEPKTYDVVIPANCTQIYVNKFYNDQSAVVKPYELSSAVKTLANTANTTANTAYASALKYNEQTAFITLDERYFSVEKTATGLDITLPYRFTMYYQSAKAAAVKNLASDVNSITYSVANGKNLIFDLTDNTMKTWEWADISPANKDNFLLMAAVGYGEINGGLLKPYWNYQLAKQAINNQYPIPYYYDSYMPDKITEIENACAYTKGISFPFITDLHLERNPKQSGKLIKYIGEHTNAVPFVISGGDIALADGTEESILAEAQMWLEYMDQWGREKTIQVHGNHDYNCRLENDGTWNATPGQLHYYIAANTLRVERPAGALYGTYDVVGENIRIIIIDDYAAGVSGDTWQATTGLTDTQLDWVKAKILEFGGSVLIVSHQTADSTLVSYESVLAPLQTMLIAAKNKTGDFSAWGGEIIMHLSGHSHQDESHVDNNFLSVTTVCDAAYTQPSGYTRTWGATSEQAFDVVCIDTAKKKIKMVRIGAGQSRTFDY